MEFSLPAVSGALGMAGAFASSAAASAGTAVGAAASMAPVAVATGAQAIPNVQSTALMVNKPVAAAASATRAPWLTRAAGFLGKALPMLAIGASAVAGASLVSSEGPSALVHTREGRSAVLGALGGGLALAPVPPAQLGAAGMFALLAANEFGALRVLDRDAPAGGEPAP